MNKVKISVSILLSILMVISLVTAVPFTAGAAETGKVSTSLESGDFEYYVLEDGTAEIDVYTGDATALEIPSSLDGYTVTRICDSAFEDCTTLTSVKIPDSVTSIGEYAFSSCESLTSVIIPDSVTSIGYSAFIGCTSLKNIEVDTNNQYYSSLDGNLYNKDQTELIQYAIGKGDTEFTIPDSVISIGDNAFYNCKSLTSVTIPNSVRNIGECAFDDCTSLTSVTIPYSVTDIGISAFGYYYDYNNEDSAVIYGFTITGYTGTEAERYANENGFEFINLGEVPTESDATVPTESDITDPTDSVSTSPTESAATNPTESVETSPTESYATNPTESVVTNPTDDESDNPTDDETEPELFSDYEYSLLDDNTAMIDNYTGNATELEIPSSLDGHTVTSIGEGAFECCVRLTSVTIPDSVTSIGSGAFEYCESLTSVTIGNGVTSIGEDVFVCCTSLTNIAVDTNNQYYSSIDGNLYNKDKTELIQYAIGKSDADFTIPDSVKSIGDYAFYDCASLTSVTICNGVRSIGESAFDDCENLKGVTIPNSVTSIGDSAFGYYFDYDNEDYVEVSGFTIYGYKGTEAERYAKENGFKFISLDKTPTAKTKITLKKSSGSVYVKGIIKIKAIVKNGKGKTTYKSSNSKVAKVSKTGKVTGLKKGTVRITVANNGVKKTFKLTVKNPKLSKNTVSVKKGKTIKVKIIGKIKGVNNKYINTKLAKVTSKKSASTLTIKGLKKGKTTLKIKVSGVTLKLKVKVK